MTYLARLLHRREVELSRLLEQLPKEYQEVPEGSIRISRSEKGASYYWRRKGTTGNGQYLRVSQMDIARQIVQHSYEEKVRTQAELQLKTIRNLLAVYKPDAITSIYDRMIPERQRLITPVIEPTEQFITHWLEAHPGHQNPYPIQAEILTEQGELVRSKSEKIIADKLYSMGIPYRYEVRLNLPGAGVIYPDFTILNKRTRKEWIWEHEGMMDDPEYSSRATIRLEDYEKNGYWPGQQLIFTCETKDHSLNMRIMNEIIERYLL